MKAGLNSANLKCVFHVFMKLGHELLSICRCLQVMAAAVLGLSNQLMDLLYMVTCLKTSLYTCHLMMYVLNAEVYAAWKVHVCLSTLACQETTASVYVN